MTQKNILIVGATSGIGLAVAKEFLRRGFKVFGTGRDLKELDQLLLQFPEKLKTLNSDIRKGQAESVIEEAQKFFGQIDVVFLNAGIAGEDSLENPETMKAILETNIFGISNYVHTSWNYFLGSPHPGTIAVNSSLAGLQGLRQAPYYSASKAFLINLCQGLRGAAHNKRLALNILDIRAGFVDTKMAGGRFWICSTDKAAKQIADAIETRKSVVYISRRWRLVAWIIKMVPGFIFEQF